MAIRNTRKNRVYGLTNPLQTVAQLPIIANRPPNITDIANLGTQWIYEDAGLIWFLSGVNNNEATWVELEASGSGGVDAVNGDGGTAIPTAGILNILGGTGIQTAGSGDTITITSLTSSGITTITGDTGGGITGSNVNFTGGTTGLSFNGSGTTETLTFAGITANGGNVNLSSDNAAAAINIGSGAANKTVTLGSNNTGSTTNIRAGSGGIQTTSFINIPTTTSTAGQIQINGTPFMHGYGVAAQNTFLGYGAGNFTMTLAQNTGIGNLCLQAVTSGQNLTAVGASSLRAVTSGTSNTAVGFLAGATITTGNGSVAIGVSAMQQGNGEDNVYIGSECGLSGSTPNNTTAIGRNALISATAGDDNVCVGKSSLGQLLTGVHNLALGTNAGNSLNGTESDNVYLGSVGVAGDNNILRIGDASGIGTYNIDRAFIHGIRGRTTVNNDAIAVLVDSAGQLGTVSSSARFKENIQDLGDEYSIMDLRPVQFNYKGRTPDQVSVGLIAEEVHAIVPSLVATDQEGMIESVKYQDLPVLLLKELQKMSSRVEYLETELKKMKEMYVNKCKS